MGQLIGVSRVDQLILFGQFQHPTCGAVGRAQLSVSTSIRIHVVRIELSYRHAGLLSRTAEVLQHQGSERKRPPEGVRVSATGVFASPDYVRLIGNTRPNADVVHAVVQERASEPGELDRNSSPAYRSTPQVIVNVVAGDAGVDGDGIGERVTGTVIQDAVTVIVHHRSGRNP